MTFEILGITGSRPYKFPIGMQRTVQESLYARILGFKNQGGQVVIQGGAIGVDQWSAEITLELGLELKTYVPFPQQADRWGVRDKGKYREILKNSSEVKVFGENPSNRLYHIRNQAIVDDSDILLATYPKGLNSGGTIATVRYALQKKPVIHHKVTGIDIETSFTQP